MIEHILNFVGKTEAIEDIDYGDFMRKENLYFLQLRQDLGREISEDAERKLNEMQEYIQFKPDWNRKSTQHRILQDSVELAQIVSESPSDYMQKNSVVDFHPHLHP